MSNIREFKTREELEKYFDANALEDLGDGAEGIVYSTNNNEIIKNMLDSWDPKEYKDYPDIIMANQLTLDSFIFPKELFLLNGMIVGYREDYFDGDILHQLYPEVDPNIDKLLKARKRFIEDVKAMTDCGYLLYELPRNVLFDNNKLVAIDTLDYKLKKDVTLDENIGIVDYGLLLELSDFYHDINIDINGQFNKEIDKVYKYQRKQNII